MKIVFNKIRQLALPLQFIKLRNKDSFIVNEKNKLAVSFLKQLIDIEKFKINYKYPILYIYGPEGSGKTYMGHIFKEMNQAKFISCLDDINIEMFRDGYSYIIDNFSCNEKINEEIFFHLINESYMGKGSILILSRYQKNNFKFKLQDLNSRLKSIMSAEIYPPGDQEIYSLLIKEMSDRKLNINDQHCYYILKRIKRDYKSVIRLCEIIDNYLLENKTKLTLSNLKIILRML